MASKEHQYLAGIIKNTHAMLREEAEDYGPEIAWKRHISRKDILQKYASCMQKLATTYWMENNTNTKNATYSRIEWIQSECEEYFLNGGRQRYDKREEDIKLKINVNSINIEIITNYTIPTELGKKISLLDVGSCFNPFGNLDMFEVTAIDLNGIPNTVLNCDFLTVPLGKEIVFSNDKQGILQLPQESFDVVVFSLFLEYLPCPKQRFICCEKAYDILQPCGILFIISPDSKHVNANAKILKSWRYVLSKLGFMRIKYEKLRHIHCIIYRKCIFKYVATRWADLQKVPENELYLDERSVYIPQDFRTVSVKVDRQKKEEYDTNEITFMFNELPFEKP